MSKWIKYSFNYDCLKKWDIFHSDLFLWKTIKDLHQLYMLEHVRALDVSIQNRIRDISNNNLLILDTKSPIVLVPIYFMESENNIKQLITLLGRQNSNFKTVFYLNWHWDISNFESKKQFLKLVIGDDDNFILYSYFYKEQPLIWTVISDFYDAVLSNLDVIEDTILLRLDSDIYHIDDDYVSDIKNILDHNTDVSYVNSEVACSHIDKDSFGWFAELLVNLAGYRNNRNQKRVPTIWSCLSIRLSDWMKIKWTQRDAYRQEDWVVGQKVSQLYWTYDVPNNNRWIWSTKKVFSSPRRQLNNLKEGRFYHRNKSWFDFISQQNLTDNFYLYDTIIDDLLHNKYVSLDDLCKIENYVNSFNIKCKNISKDLQQHRKKNILKDSLYNVYIDNNGMIEFGEK